MLVIQYFKHARKQGKKNKFINILELKFPGSATMKDYLLLETAECV